MKLEISDAYVDLVTEAHAYATARQDELRRDFRLGEWARWDWNQDTGQLVFAERAGGPPRVVCDIQFTGSISTEGGTWLWSWANSHFDPRWTRDVRDVRLVGESRGIPQLTEPKWEANEALGWEMTSITAFVLRAKGVYRTPREGGFTFMVLTSVRWADEATAR
jgi:hypothetical protein